MPQEAMGHHRLPCIIRPSVRVRDGLAALVDMSQDGKANIAKHMPPNAVNMTNTAASSYEFWADTKSN